ncbi:8-oxoguanine DNA glycosylase OGG fold protein [Corynebacterium sp. A21]|uniref:8-oxoguanine DNA glycosylase OGG fold protein n=1 Tax=Corynebacterium sp. A21 TaxID=3457318 RepID=UPI003FD2D0C3
MTNLRNLEPPIWLSEWLETANPSVDLFHQGAWVNRSAMEDELRRQGFEHRILGDWITRTQLFELAGWAQESREGALTLLWNSLAWAEGRANRNNRRRIRVVAADQERIADVLIAAARLSHIDGATAYTRLLHGIRSPEIPTVGAAVFSKYLYFCGGGRVGHQCLILDRHIADGLVEAGWEGMRRSNWSAAEYTEYLDLLESWRVTLTPEHPRLRVDLIERALAEHGADLRTPM